MKLRYTPRSPYVRKVMVTAHELGFISRIEKITTDVLPTRPNIELSIENPLVKLPTLTTDDGYVLYDSPVICEYLDSLHSGDKLFPILGPARWTALRRQALGDGILEALILCLYESRRPENLRWIDWHEGQIFKVHCALDALELEDLEGPFDIGKLTIACALGYSDFRFPKNDWRRGRPRLQAWYSKVERRPSISETVPRMTPDAPAHAYT